jgi:hypothetical protein
MVAKHQPPSPVEQVDQLDAILQNGLSRYAVHQHIREYFLCYMSLIRIPVEKKNSHLTSTSTHKQNNQNTKVFW